MTDYLVIGAGISGLTAAGDILEQDPTAQIQVIEAADRVGGKLRGAQVADRWVDVGAEAVLSRRPEALELIHRAGLADSLVHPTGASAQVWSRGRLHPIPARTMMGVPADVDALHGLLTEAEVERARAEEAGTGPVQEDLSVGELISSRLGAAVTQRLVEPLLGGVYAGHADLLSAAAALPVLFRAAAAGESLVGTVARVMPPVDADPAAPRTDLPEPRPPVFASLEGGLHRLPAGLAEQLAARGVQIRTGTIARQLHRVDAGDGGGFEVETGPRPSPTTYRADRVLLALPPAPASRLLSDLAPRAAELLGQIETASMAVVTFAFDAAQLGELRGSGVLVPPVEGRRVKASTFSAGKWDSVRELGRGAGPQGADLTFLRASVGRHREEASLQVSDPQLVELCLADLGDFLGRPMPDPVDTHVQRWGGGLPQYAVGHLDLIEQARAALAELEGLAACGAAFDGVGIPACIASAHRAVEDLFGARGTMTT